MPTPEAPVKRFVKEWFDSLTAWHYAPVQNGLGVVGIPDRVGCVPVTITPDMVGKTVGLFVAVECKAPGKEHTVTPNQRRQLDAIHNAHGIGLVVSRKQDLPDLTAFLHDHQ